MRGTVENVVFQKHSAACKHPLTHAWTLTRRVKKPCILTSGAEQGHIRDAKQPGDWEKMLAEDFLCFSLATHYIFTSSLLLCVCVSVCSRACVYSGCRLGWLLWYYWVSNKPAREAPMGCTKCFPLAGVDRGAVSCSMSRRTGRRIGRVRSWFPLSNRSLAGAQGLQIPARRGESCRSVCASVSVS